MGAVGRFNIERGHKEYHDKLPNIKAVPSKAKKREFEVKVENLEDLKMRIEMLDKRLVISEDTGREFCRRGTDINPRKLKPTDMLTLFQLGVNLTFQSTLGDKVVLWCCTGLKSLLLRLATMGGQPFMRKNPIINKWPLFQNKKNSTNRGQWISVHTAPIVKCNLKRIISCCEV